MARKPRIEIEGGLYHVLARFARGVRHAKCNSPALKF